MAGTTTTRIGITIEIATGTGIGTTIVTMIATTIVTMIATAIVIAIIVIAIGTTIAIAIGITTGTFIAITIVGGRGVANCCIRQIEEAKVLRSKQQQRALGNVAQIADSPRLGFSLLNLSALRMSRSNCLEITTAHTFRA